MDRLQKSIYLGILFLFKKFKIFVYIFRWEDKNMQFKKKEWIFIAGVLVITVCMVFYPKLKQGQTADSLEEPVKADRSQEVKQYIQLTVTGELIVDRLELTVPYGSAYGDVVKILQSYTNAYSILQVECEPRFLKDTTLVIPSRDNLKESFSQENGKIVLSDASKEELIQLYGIGEKRAEKIINYRETRKIASFEELKKIIGVSDEIIERIKEQAIL